MSGFFALLAALDPGSVIYPGHVAADVAAHPGAGTGGAAAAALFAAAGAAVGWLLWRRFRGTPSDASRDRLERQLSIAETRSLGNRQYLVVAAYGGRRYLLGVCPGRIDLLSPLDGGAAPTPLR